MMEKLRIVFIGYWGVEEGLTVSTILPWLRIMQAAEEVEQVTFCTIERNSVPSGANNNLPALLKIKHVPLYSVSRGAVLATKISDFVQFPREISHLVQQHKANLLFAHGAPAGALAYKVWKTNRLPFYVSSFEPHADYMLESGVWNKRGLKYLFQKYWERKQILHASGLIPVAETYRQSLLQKGVPAHKVKVVPSPVRLQEFAFNPALRAKVRDRLHLQNAIVGIYAGKYGDMYYREEAFCIYQKCFDVIDDFRLIILSPQPKEEILQLLREKDIDSSKVYVTSVLHHEVPAYLSASDFAFATYRASLSKKYLSPVKVGEYWANGLPVLLTEGVGDDSEIIKGEGGGALFNLEEDKSVEKAIAKVIRVVKEPNHRKQIYKLAEKYRSEDKMQEAFDYFFGKEQGGQR